MFEDVFGLERYSLYRMSDDSSKKKSLLVKMIVLESFSFSESIFFDKLFFISLFHGSLSCSMAIFAMLFWIDVSSLFFIADLFMPPFVFLSQYQAPLGCCFLLFSRFSS